MQPNQVYQVLQLIRFYQTIIYPKVEQAYSWINLSVVDSVSDFGQSSESGLAKGIVKRGPGRGKKVKKAA